MAVRNPLEWSWDKLTFSTTAGRLPRDSTLARPVPARLAVRPIGLADLRAALREGSADFGASRTDIIFLCIIYPLVGLVLARFAFGQGILPLLFPLTAGFALLGPFASVGLNEMSRRRENGAVVSWADAFGVFRSPAFGSVLLLGLLMVAIFVVWLAAADLIFTMTLGPALPVSVAGFARDVLTTPGGWAMIGLGCGVGFLFAVMVLTISVVSFPLLLDRNVTVGTAIQTSIAAVKRNPGPMAVWGLVIVAGLVVGSIPLLIGLTIVMPVLGHATWHLYRKVVAAG